MTNNDFAIRKKLLEFLLEYITPNKRELFQKVIAFRTRHITVVLEDLFQPHNASAVLRSCDCLGVQDVHIIENNNTYEVNREVAMGASKWLDLIKYSEKENNTTDAVEKLKKNGYRIVATTPHKEDFTLADIPLQNKIALFFGTELTGLTNEVIERADMFLRIPMYGFTESYNISVSAALSLYALTERLHRSSLNWRLPETEKTEVLINWCKKLIRKPEVFERSFYNSLKDE
jgi:tRNA (guanosine-2'-O-)-methyltransferase